MQECFTCRQMELRNQLRKLWEQHVFWTRLFIISTAGCLGDVELVTRRLLRNPGDFALVFLPFFGRNAACRFRNLFTEHLTIAGDLVNAAKCQDTAAADAARRKWYANADELAKLFAEMNPHWSERKWRIMLHTHLEMTEKQAALRLAGHFAEDIQIFDRIEEEALKMADYMWEGILLQCEIR